MRNLMLRIAYDGTDFVGSQWQKHGRSVQSELEGAWLQFTQEERRFLLAGRTDAGVHAQGQVANVRTETKHSLAVVQRALNAILPNDVVVLSVDEVPLEFHARRSAIWRKYHYLIDNEPVPLPFLRRYALHVGETLDRAAMEAALHVLPGRHDFAAFTRVNPAQESTVRQCHRATCQSSAHFGRSLIAIELVANAFLHHMVRSIVGTLLLVGRGQRTARDFEQVLTGRDRRRAGPTAAAHGLTLLEVGYPSASLALDGSAVSQKEEE